MSASTEDALGLEMCAEASGMLRAAGFVLANASRSSEACYYAFPGRVGLLRVAAHGSSGPVHRDSRQPVAARLTFSPNIRPRSPEGMEKLVALVIGKFFLRTGRPSGCEPTVREERAA